MLDELIQLYSYADDLDTHEHAAKELSTFFAGPVSLTNCQFTHSRFSDRVGQTYRAVKEICLMMYVIQLSYPDGSSPPVKHFD